MATWMPNEDALIEGRTNDQVHALLPHRTKAAIQKRREVLGIRHPRAGEPTPHMPPDAQNWHESDDRPNPVVEFIDKKRGSFNWRDANKVLTDMQTLAHNASSSQDTATIRINTDKPAFCLFLSDTHLGDWATDYDLFARITDEILSTPNLYVALLGDMVNMAIAMRNVAEVAGGNLLPPELQAEYFSSWLDEVKDRVLLATWDNHAVMREEKGSGISMFKAIQSKHVVYHNGIGHPDIQVGEQTYKFAVSHRFRGSSIENPCHATMRYLRREGHDRELAAMGDIHQAGIVKFNHGPTPKVAVNTGSLQINSGYARRHFSLFTSPVMPGVLLHPDRHIITPMWSVAEYKAMIA